jgi:hypothetical protein
LSARKPNRKVIKAKVAGRISPGTQVGIPPKVRLPIRASFLMNFMAAKVRSPQIANEKR